jgi:serine/threonine protein phosphatase PrpC/LysM repeat protein
MHKGELFIMNGIINLSVTAVSKTCVSGAVNNDRFYINGRHIYRYETESVQLSVENSGNEYIIALGSEMDREDVNSENSFSTMEELEKFQKQTRTDNVDMDSRFEGFYDCVKEAGDIIYSLDAKSEGYVSPPSFAGLILASNKAAVLNMGGSRIYMFRGGSIRQLTSDYKKAERLRKLGILTDEQAEVLSTHFGISADAEKADIKRSEVFNFNEGDVFLICGPGIVDAVDEEIFPEIISTARTPDDALNMLISEAIKNGCEGSATAVIVSIRSLNAHSEIEDNENNGYDEEDESSLNSDDNEFTFKSRGYMSKNSIEMGKNRSRKKRMIKKIVSTTVACVVVVLMIYGLVKVGNIILGDPQENDTPAFTDDEATQSYDETEDETESSYETTNDEISEETDASTSETNNGNEPRNEEPVFYEVKSGDTLYAIARKFYNDPEKYKLISEENNIANPDDIKAGQILTIPELP